MYSPLYNYWNRGGNSFILAVHCKLLSLTLINEYETRDQLFSFRL